MNNLGIAVRDARRRKKLSQQKLADLVEVSRSTIANLELLGKGTTELVQRVADELEMEELPMGPRSLRWGDIEEEQVALALGVAIDLLTALRDSLISDDAPRKANQARAIESALGRLLGKAPAGGLKTASQVSARNRRASAL